MKANDLTATEIQRQADEFLNKIFRKAGSAHLNLQPHWDIDHLCFRVQSLEEYESYKESLSLLGNLLIESDVNGRPIASYELNYPIKFQNWLIKVIELPAPKKGKTCNTGFEHIEVVVDTSLENLAKDYEALNWDRSGLKKLFNPELELSFGDCAIKFHNISLKSIINFEKRPKFAMLVTELRLFETFKNNEPFIAGTIPLAIDTDTAALDFLVTFPTHQEFSDVCTQEFSHIPNFELSQGHQNGADYSLCKMRYRDLPVEIFSSTDSTFSQNGFLHFQAEEKLLKYGLTDWQADVIKLKSNGLKTEPAFALLLKQAEVDPYQYILAVQKKTIRELRETIQTVLLLN